MKGTPKQALQAIHPKRTDRIRFGNARAHSKPVPGLKFDRRDRGRGILLFYPREMHSLLHSRILE